MLALLCVAACRPSQGPAEAKSGGRTRVTFKLQPLGTSPAFREWIAAFEREHPEVEVDTELLPNASDVAHQYFLTALEGGSRDFDLLVVDTVWVHEFARAGWIADVSEAFPPEALKRDFLPGPVEASVMDGRTYAVPWYVDVGMLYYRKDLVPRAPRTYEELRTFTADTLKKHPDMVGYMWQGRQYEGLVCNVYEAIWGHGGGTLQGERMQLDTPEARAGLAYLRDLVRTGLSPPSVTSAAEEEARRVFHAGRAVFLRSWPYAWTESEKPGSPIRGKVDFAALPTLTGEPGHGTLGGWQVALNAHSPPEKRKAALALMTHLTSTRANVMMALSYGRNPPRREAYEDPELREKLPHLVKLLPIIERAKPRPATPYYPLLSDVLQSEFSAVVAGIRSPEDALGRAQHRADQLTGVER
jgi:multiple sugar transport system substrate-binding protein